MAKRIVSMVLAALMTACLLASCSNSSIPNETPSAADGDTSVTAEIKNFTAFIAMPGTELPDDNRMLDKIADKIGAKVDVKWLIGQTAAERIGVMVAGGDYPDFVCASDGTKSMLEAGAYIPLDEYFDQYPNIKDYLSPEDWEKLRSEDGHIYIIPLFGIMRGEDRRTSHNDEAFWIQKRVLEWADYPTIKTVDQYFKVISDYLAANPTTADDQNNIGFEICSDDWRYFCLENPPQFVAGYPNDGCCVVDRETLQAKTYDMLPEAKQYFDILNVQYHAGLIDPETFTLSWDQYIAKLSSGRVCGIVDQGWDFLDAQNSLVSQAKDECTYIPLSITLDANVTGAYFAPQALDVSNGLGITTSCKDVEGALKFMNDMLDNELMVMRYWGEEGVDYEVDEDGIFYRNEEQRANQKNVEWINQNFVSSGYSYFPHFEGVLQDGKNSILPNEQPDEFYAALSDVDKKVLDAYGFKVWTDFLDPVEKNTPWFPMWSYTNNWTADTPYGIANQKMADVKHEWLPKIIMSSDYEDAWNQYVAVYNQECDVQAYETELTAEVQRRIATWEKGTGQKWSNS
ncbi:MAG: sugar ABC transporter substrate-binding protein [Acetanaerobacterium sp.]